MDDRLLDRDWQRWARYVERMAAVPVVSPEASIVGVSWSDALDRDEEIVDSAGERP